MRFSSDTGGTFTDLIVEHDDGEYRMYKSPTTADDPVRGLLDALALAAADHGEELSRFVGRADMLMHGTTHAINAIVTGRTAKTAFLTTEGHPDILVLREGGRTEPFDFTVPYPEPYIPRALTFQVPERVTASGAVRRPLDEERVIAIIEQLAEQHIEAIAVCLLWSILLPDHELRVGELIAEHLPGVPFTLSHQLNPVLREYRRASAAAIDASLKPLMESYLGGLEERLGAIGFSGRTLVLTSNGATLDSAEVAASPIHVINSGPSMAPIAGRRYAQLESSAANAIIADTGGTTFDVSLVRRGRIPHTKETWIGPPFRGHMTGFSSIDIKSVGAGGGSIAWVDDGGVLHVGPQSAGATPGPACYGAGGTDATLTDACVVLGIVDPAFFLGGAMQLDSDAAATAVSLVAERLGLSLDDASAAIVQVVTENMVQAIEDITVNQGIDPHDAVLIGGGGAAGLNALAIARRLGCGSVVIPDVGAALSAAGSLITDLAMEYHSTFVTTTDAFDQDGANRVLESLSERCEAFAAGPGGDAVSSEIDLVVEARYAHQVWEIDLPLPDSRFETAAQVETLVEDFHQLHEEIFAIRDPGSVVELVGWKATVRCRLAHNEGGRVASTDSDADTVTRRLYIGGVGAVDAAVHRIDSLEVDAANSGPAIIESPFTTVVAEPGSQFVRTRNGNLVLSFIESGVS
jgi:N-methylhydantoinase A